MTTRTSSVNRFDIERSKMIEFLKKKEIMDEAVLEAMRTIPRHFFVKDIFQSRAYEDSALPIDCQQTISQPYTVAFMTQLLQVKADEKVLEVGTGSGYQAALLAKIGARVFTIERHFELLESARKRFDSLKLNIASKVGDGSVGWSEYAPYDKIIVTAGAPEIPKSLVAQLKIGGVMIIPVGNESAQTMVVVTKTDRDVEMVEVEGFRFVPLVGKEGWKK